MQSHTLNRVVATVAVAGIALALAGCSSSSKSSDTPVSPSTAAMASEQSIVQTAASNADFSTLVSAVKAAGLANTLSGSGPFTIFAPTNEAFAQLPAGTLQGLLKPENKQKLAAVLTYHAVPGEIMAADVKAGKVKTVNGAELTVGVDNGAVTITDARGNTAKVVKTDIAASNGVIHVIDRVLLPPQ